MINFYLNKKVSIENLITINSKETNIIKFLTKKNKSFKKFGELYGSFILKNKIKAWKIQKKNSMNLFVPFGKVKVVCYYKQGTVEFILNSKSPQKLNILPGVYYGFKGLVKKSLILSLLDDLHDNISSINIPSKLIDYDW